MLNYNEAPGIPSTPQAITNFEPIAIQPSDIIQIGISSADPASIQAFGGGSGSEEGEEGQSSGFLVDSEGFIDFPTLGRIKVAGLTVEEIKAEVQRLLQPYFKQVPIVNVRLTNFKINVNGEVNNPGTFQVYNDRVTLIEALSLAGDFTSYSRRDSILIIREKAGMRSFGYVNFNSSDVFNSPYFYLQQNDVVYVRPEKSKTSTLRDPASRYLPWVTSIVSITAIIITLTR